MLPLFHHHCLYTSSPPLIMAIFMLNSKNHPTDKASAPPPRLSTPSHEAIPVIPAPATRCRRTQHLILAQTLSIHPSNGTKFHASFWRHKDKSDTNGPSLKRSETRRGDRSRNVGNCNVWALSYDSTDQEEVTIRMNRSLEEAEEVLPAWVTTQVWTSEATEVADTRKEKKKKKP